MARVGIEPSRVRCDAPQAGGFRREEIEFVERDGVSLSLWTGTISGHLRSR